MAQIDNIPARGYKPQVISALLDINRETLRYWRQHVDPSPHRHYYSSGALLAYQLIKTLVRKKHLPVEVLKQCQWQQIFRLCESLPLMSLAACFLVVDERTLKVELLTSLEAYDENDLDLHRLPMKPVVDAHIDALLGFGQQ